MGRTQVVDSIQIYGSYTFVFLRSKKRQLKEELHTWLIMIGLFGPACLVDFEVIMFIASTCKIFRIDGAYFTIEGGGILHINEIWKPSRVKVKNRM